LWRGDVSVVLPPKVFDLLKLLVEQSGSTLDKETLLAQLWPDSFVEESSLTQLVFQLRKTLGESAAKQQYVETIPRRGYRFVGEVQQRRARDPLGIANGVATAEPEIATTLTPKSPSLNGHLTIQPHASRWWWALLLLVLLLAFAAYRWLASSRTPLPFQTKTIRKLTTAHQARHPSLTPDGQWVVFSSRAPGQHIAKVSIEGGEPIGLVSHVSSRPVVAPDGQWIACLYLDEEHNRIEIALVPSVGGAATKILRGMPRPDWDSFKWTPDSRALTFIQTQNGVSNLWAQPIDGSPPQQLTQFNSDRIFRFAWSRDGKFLACERGEDLKDVVLISDFRNY
jgi:DNA-binding winged helix-turn-helix (wHTH) protein